MTPTKSQSAVSPVSACASLPAEVASRPQGCEKAESPIVKKLFELHHMMMRVGDRMASPHGLTSSRWMMLCAIGQADEPATINEISERANQSPQNVSRMVGSMEEDGLVCRFSLPGRGRSTFVGLTTDGWAAYETTKRLAEAFCNPFLEGFSESRTDRLDRDLGKLIDNMARLETALIADPDRALGDGDQQ